MSKSTRASLVIAFAMMSFFIVSGTIIGRAPYLSSAVLFIWLVTLSYIDLKWKLLPDFLTLSLLGVGLVNTWVVGGSLWSSILGASVGYGVIVCLAKYWRQTRGYDGIGLGDAKLLAASGSWLGLPHLPAVLLASSGMGLFAFGLRWGIENEKFSFKEAMPFGPFIAFSTWSIWCINSAQLA